MQAIGTAACAADLDVDREHTLETLRPSHRCPMFGGCWRFTRYFSLVPFAALGGRHPRAVFTVGGEDAVAWELGRRAHNGQ